VIGYDISDPRRLLRVHREMCKHATPLEYSIFLLVGSEADKERCLEEIAELIEPRDDDVRCYALPRAVFRAASGAPACRRESCGPGCRRRSLETRFPA
jgi:CRISPR/Cas system-associated endoribonuclease Cas2